MMNKYAKIGLWGLMLGLGVTADILFWMQPGGINFVLFTSLLLAAGMGWLRWQGVLPGRQSLWLAGCALVFSIQTFGRQEPLSGGLAHFFTLLSLATLAANLQDGQWPGYGISKHIVKMLDLADLLIVGALPAWRELREQPGAQGALKRLAAILRGLLYAAPILFLFTSLLSSADLVFHSRVDELARSFADVTRGPTLFRNAYRAGAILSLAHMLTGAILYAAGKSKNQPEVRPIQIRFFGFTESVIVKASLSALFLAFVLIQFRYFFGGNLNVGETGFTYSEYARRGFNELLTVAMFSLFLLIGLNAITPRNNPRQHAVYSGLSILIGALVLVMLVSAFQRLELAIDWHGFSRLRLYPRVFMVWMGLLFIAVVTLETLRREKYVTFSILLAALGFTLSLGIINVDAAIVHHNVWRAEQGRHFNPAYLATLSSDAMPALADEFSRPGLPTAIREGLGAALLCQGQSLAKENIQARSWQSFDISLWLAQESLAKVRSQLNEYHLNTRKTPNRVRTPGNILYECQGWD